MSTDAIGAFSQPPIPAAVISLPDRAELVQRRCLQPEEGQRLLSASQSTCGNHQAKEKFLHPVSWQQLLARVARGTVTYLRLMSPLLEQRDAVSAVTPALLMELLWRLRQTGEGVRAGQAWHRR